MSLEPPMTDPRRKPSRFRFQWRQSLVLAIVWVVLVGQVNLVSVLGGLLLAWLVTVVFPLPPVSYAGRLHPWGFAKLTLAVLVDLAVASATLARFAFGRRMPRTGIVRVRLRSDSDLYQMLVSMLVSIVPGTIVLDARRSNRMLYLHVFDTPEGHHIESAAEDALGIERRVVGALGSRAEQEVVRETGSQEDAAGPARSVSAQAGEEES